MNLKELKEKKITELSGLAQDLGVEGASGMRKQDLIFAILNATSAKNGAIFNMISDLDTDGNGTIDFGEWVTLLTKKVNDKDSRNNIAKVFPLYDRDGSGTITLASLRQVADELGETVDDKELEELLVRADANGDGVIDFEEFYTIVTRQIRE